jgi:hypothetical protein
MVNTSKDLTERCVDYLASKYNFDAEEAKSMLGLNMVKMERKVSSKKEIKVAKVERSAFPLPWSGEFNDCNCHALRQNNGLYTQCSGLRKGENEFCKGCASQMQKTGAEVPEYGTIQQRMATGIFEYVDPKGRKPIAYTKIMKKYKLTQEMVLEEAGKLNITINPDHFLAPEESVKRGRPTTPKEPKEKGVKGRPKKSKKVVEIDGDTEDLFATLVKTANMEEEIQETPIEAEVTPKKKSRNAGALGKSDEEKEAKRLAAEKAKAEKEAKLAAEKAEKEAKKEAERLAKEAKKKAEEEAKLAKKAALEEAKKAKEESKKAKEESKKAKEAKKPAAKIEEDEEPDVVKKIEFEGKKYLKSKNTGIVYDYEEYTKNGEQVVVGKWNETSNKIDFESAEVEEEEYDE